MSNIFSIQLYKMNCYFVCSIFILGVSFNTGCETTTASPSHYIAHDEPLDLIIDKGAISLSKGSVLEIFEQDDTSQKIVSVKGRSFFDLGKSSDLTWLVGTDSLTIHAKGAAFSVWNKAGIIQIAVKHGKVLATKDKRKVEIFAGNMMIFSDDDMVVTRIPSVNWFSWVDKKIQFENDILRDVIRDLNHTFDIPILVENHIRLNKCSISGIFENVTLSVILDILMSEYGLSYSNKEDGTIVIADIQC